MPICLMHPRMVNRRVKGRQSGKTECTVVPILHVPSAVQLLSTGTPSWPNHLSNRDSNTEDEAVATSDERDKETEGISESTLDEVLNLLDSVDLSFMCVYS